MVNGFQTEIRHKVLSFWSHLEIVPFSLTSSLQEQGIYLYQDFYTNKNLIPEAKHIQVTALKGGLLKTNNDFEGIVLKGVGADFDWKNLSTYLVEGKQFDFDSNAAQHPLLISKATADRLLLKVNDKVLVSFMGRTIRNRPFKVSGIFETGMEEFDKKYAITNIHVIQELNNWGSDTVGGFEVFLKEENLFKQRSQSYFLTLFGSLLSEEKFTELARDPLENIGEEVYDRVNNPKLDVQTIKNISPGIFDWLDLQTMNELIILSLMLLVAAINMITALLILILERTNMIGILKALGSDSISIRKIFIWYSAFIVGIGLLLGNVFGIGLCLLQQHFHFITLPQESYYLSYAPVQINWWWLAGMNAATVVFTLLLLVIPSMLISKISPVKAIRFE